MRPKFKKLYLLFSLTAALSMISKTSHASSSDSKSSLTQLEIPSASEVYGLSAATLKYALTIAKGTVIKFDAQANPENYDYIDSNGVRRRSSTGFYQIQIVQISGQTEQLYILGSILNEALSQDAIQPLPSTQPQGDYLKMYEASGRPKFNFSRRFETRFGSQLNRVYGANELSAAERAKWASIMSELEKVGDRKRQTPAQLLYISQPLAKKYSEDFENTGVIQNFGAWSIAVTGTARRHGFENVPCAEFMSEVLRQAYTRAGYDVKAEFNTSKANPLIWTNTAAVVNLATAMAKGGWIPWEAFKFKPKTGAIVMNYLADSPGHAYMFGGENGQIIVDNGSPRGRDLRGTTFKIIDMMYQHGVFFLPPGVTPEAW